jgi:hypothetical protein
MFALSKLWTAITRLTAGLESLADTVEQTNSGLRSRLHLDQPEALEHRPNSQPETPEEEEGGRKNGRARTKAGR